MEAEVHLSSVIRGSRTEPTTAVAVRQRPFGPLAAARRTLTALLCAGAVFAAGCHSNNNTSGYGIAWVTLTDSPGDFTSYIVNVDSIVLTRSDSYLATALATAETVDLTKLNNIAELWGTATIPTGTYTSASIVVDYTNADISVMVNGLPTKATVVDPSGAAITTQTITVILDPAHPLVIPATYATTAAQRLALDFNLAASTQQVNLAASPPTVQVVPYMTAAIAPPDNKTIRVRGPLINSSVDLGTYTVYLRPFYDEIDNLGSLSLFTSSNTIFAINGVVSKGGAGITQLSQSSAGTTVTAAYATYQPTATPNATAGKFNALYVVAGSTLEDVYTQGLEGDVIARNGNTLTLQGATLFVNNEASTSEITYYVANATVVVGAGTLVTADDSISPGLDSSSIGVGQHIIARGISTVENSVVSLDATGTQDTNTGSVRLITTELYGSLVSSTTGGLTMNLLTIGDWPVADFTFAGNGTTSATDPTAANFVVNTGTLTLPTANAGDPIFVDGTVARFGSAPPDFTASAVDDELGIQTVGTTATSPTPLSCGQGVLNCVPASMQVVWTSPGTAAPFSALTGTAMAIDLSNSSITSAIIRIGAESISMASLPASPQIIPTAPLAPVTASAGTSGSVTVTLPPIFLPAYSIGNPAAVAPLGINVYSVFATFAASAPAAIAAAPARQFEARGTYDRATNTFNATSVNVVLD